MINYLSDREQVRDSVGAFTRFLLDIDALAASNERDCFSTTFCIAHSMGNYFLRKGLEYLSDQLGSPTGRKLFDETLMMAPPPAAFIRSPTRAERRHGPVRFTSITLRHNSSETDDGES